MRTLARLLLHLLPALAARSAGDGPALAQVEVAFAEEGSLGLKFTADASGRTVIKAINPGTQATGHSQLCEGLVLRSVGGTMVIDLPYANVVQLIKASAERPLHTVFEVPDLDKCDAGAPRDSEGNCAPALSTGTGAGPKPVGFAGSTVALPIPNVSAGEFVVDWAQLLSAEEMEALLEELTIMTRNSTMQPMVLTLHQIPQPSPGIKLQRRQLVRSFGNQLARHWFPSQQFYQAKLVLYIVQSGLVPPKMDIYAGRRAKSKLKDGRIRGLLRHPNITRGLEADPPTYGLAIRTAIRRSLTIVQQSSGIFAAGNGLRGFMPLMLGGCFFMCAVSTCTIRDVARC